MIKDISKIIDSKQLRNAVASFKEIDKNITLFLNDSSISPLLATALDQPFIFVTPSIDSAMHAESILKDAKISHKCIMHAPDMPLYSETKNPISEHLYSAISQFKHGTIDAIIIVASALLSCVPTVESIPLKIKINQTIKQKDVIQFIEDTGYERVQVVTQPRDFSVRGDVIDIWCNTTDKPTRIMFFGDTVEDIRSINPQNLTTIAKLNEISIPRLTQVGNISAELIRKKLETVNTTHENTKNIISSINTRLDKLENLGNNKWLYPFVCDFENIANSLTKTNCLFIFDRANEIHNILRETEKLNASRLASLIDGGLLQTKHANMFCSTQDTIKSLSNHLCIGIQTLNQNHELFKSNHTIELKTLPTTNYFNAISALVPDLVRNTDTHKKTAMVFVGNSKAAENYMMSKGVPFVAHNSFAKPTIGQINVFRKPLSVSFELPDARTVIYSVAAPIKATETPLPKKDGANFIMPQVGDVVVHEFHGLGRYLGSKHLTLADEEKEYLVLQYDGGALVYVPSTGTEVLSNYHGEPTRLNRIGGKDFANAKQRVRHRLRELGFKLHELYARRAGARPTKYETDIETMRVFHESFPHVYTRDQLSAIADIDKDMQNTVMDRLICGDVGFGKTEVALHAAFRAIMAGYQVALLCPTTILSIQHTNTAKARLEQFGVKIETLNRFKTASEVAKILEQLEHGEIDMIIGTHRLLSTDITFKDLALLILDEEQRFGVAHKEQIKQIKTNVDVLTLTATPIPRTLNMALIGIRDISHIATPPKNRSPIITYVTEYSDELVIDAISREKARDGQTLVLFNNVEYIETFAEKMRNILPQGLRIATIHGQMNTNQLESTILKMYAKEIDVLVASTIIENGIDIPTANTLIVIDADYLGVAQMHQLRGRVGRSQVQAYAYFTYHPNKEITQIAHERLVAIQNFASHGGGYNIAMRDLQLRGAGDLLGADQSGHIAQIGFEMYTKILQEIAEEIKSEN
ncbi:MAG: DEAD/DEAH box helicase [Firmicutes bacterium]|nr:DEAD/DEAH box helicase [Bacillota bacterium]